MAPAGPELVHGTAIALAARAALIRGAPGSGKSDLALRCLAVPASGLIREQPLLVADDQVLIEPRDGRLVLGCPAPIKGLIEVRGVGILPVPTREAADLALVVDLVAADAVERLPDPESTVDLMGVPVRRLALYAFEASASLKLLLALQDAADGGPVPR